MAEPVDSGGCQDEVGKSIDPLGDIQVGSDDGAFALVPLGDHIVEVFVLGPAEGLEVEVVDDEKIDRGSLTDCLSRLLVALAALSWASILETLVNRKSHPDRMAQCPRA
jgi:hypothetical protein